MKFLVYSSRFLFWTSLILAPAARGGMVQYDVQIDDPASQRDPAFHLTLCLYCLIFYSTLAL
jgi:hypothetical protein